MLNHCENPRLAPWNILPAIQLDFWGFVESFGKQVILRQKTVNLGLLMLELYSCVWELSNVSNIFAIKNASLMFKFFCITLDK